MRLWEEVLKIFVHIGHICVCVTMVFAGTGSYNNHLRILDGCRYVSEWRTMLFHWETHSNINAPPQTVRDGLMDDYVRVLSLMHSTNAWFLFKSMPRAFLMAITTSNMETLLFLNELNWSIKFPIKKIIISKLFMCKRHTLMDNFDFFFKREYVHWISVNRLIDEAGLLFAGLNDCQ